MADAALIGTTARKLAEAMSAIQDLGFITDHQLDVLIKWAIGETPVPSTKTVTRGNLIAALMELRLKRLSSMDGQGC